MILRNKLTAVALGSALLGGSVGALVMRPAKNAETASAPAAQQQAAPVAGSQLAASSTQQPLVAANEENAAYREGFTEGVRAAREEGLATADDASAPKTAGVVVAQPVATRTRYVRSGSSSRRVYYDYNNAPRQRSFWQKHRDKLTVAMGTGGGALLGGLIGGKKGAAIGALAGGGGSALYTYKIRKRNRNY